MTSIIHKSNRTGAVYHNSRIFDEATLYQEILADMRFWKNQQWLVTTYIIGIYAVLISLLDVLDKMNRHCLDITLSVFSLLIMVVIFYGSLIILNYSKKLCESRKHKEGIMHKYANLEKLLGKEGINKKDIQYITVLLISVIVIGGLIVLWYFYMKLFINTGIG